jgi:hypothetical protein
METIRAVLYVVAVLLLFAAGVMVLAGVPRAAAPALFGASLGLLAFALPAIAAT